MRAGAWLFLRARQPGRVLLAAFACAVLTAALCAVPLPGTATGESVPPYGYLLAPAAMPPLLAFALPSLTEWVEPRSGRAVSLRVAHSCALIMVCVAAVVPSAWAARRFGPTSTGILGLEQPPIASYLGATIENTLVVLGVTLVCLSLIHI